MSFIDAVKGIGNFLTSNTLGANLAKTALYGFALSKVAKSIQKEQDDALENISTQISVNPSTDNSIPVIYGTAYSSGMITDAYMADNNKTMWVCLTISEMTGNLINGTASAISFGEVYYNGLRLDFQSNGYTVDKAYDDYGNETSDFSGLIDIYPFVDGSANPVSFTTESTGNSTNADSLFPTWTSTDDMNGLVFALIKITYSPKNNITNIGDFKFNISNTMKQPGDVLFDYMTNTRYGAGIPEAEINK
jgi:hypothetical protein